MTPSNNNRPAPSVSVLAALTVLGLAAAATLSASTAAAMSTGAIRPGDKPLSLTAADATCPANTSTPPKFPLFPLPQAQVSYKITLTPTTPAAGEGSATTKRIEIKVPAQLLQSDFNSLALAADATSGATRWVNPTNLLEFVTRMPTLLANAQLPANIPVDRATQQFADLIADIFDAKGHEHANPTAGAKVIGASNVWQVAILASDQASDLFERTDKPKPGVGDNPQVLKLNPFADKRAINVLKVVDRVRDRAEAARQRMMLTPDTAAMQRAFERIDGVGYLFSNFREPQWGQDSVNSYAMSLRDFARTVDRHLTRLQGKADETRGFKVTHKYKVTTTTTNADKVKVLEQVFNTPGAQFTGAFGVLQQQQTSPVNQFANPAVLGGPVKTNKLDGCGIDNVQFTVYANGNKMIPVPYKGPKTFATTEPIQQHVYRWTVPSADSSSAAASRSLQKSIIESARSTKQLQWTLEAIATTEASAGCPRVPVVPFVVNGVVPCSPPLKDVTPTKEPKPSPTAAGQKPTSTASADKDKVKDKKGKKAKNKGKGSNKPADKDAKMGDDKDKQKTAAKAKVVKCKSRCSAGCRARCEDMCEDRCEDRYGFNVRRGGCSSCASPCARRSASMRRACALANEPVTEEQAAAPGTQFSQEEDAVGEETDFAFTDASAVDEDAFEGASDDGADEQDFSVDEDAADEADFSLDDLVDEDAADEEGADEADFAAEDSIDEDAIDEEGADEADFSVEDNFDEDGADEADFSADDALDEDALEETDFAAEDLLDEDAIEDDGAEEFALGDNLADLLDEESFEDDA
ncbi:hypothetical protein BCR44DRAFT_60506 [Catenaria anguillulae PL171]|uniref:Uncharacterized protein n=1 Tax=Catenaria anguillulae PL171 TaxID=765915 RepID=A0A1Y2I624_9FUNG|nr:hypothetical protein BCR44DRAFT_60506 [Catenaria anguillulae PL171]